MSDPFPILIGITGKRRFDTDPVRDAEVANHVRVRLDAVLRELDRRCPSVPKVLLTGGALGTDLLAAEVALAAGPHWSVALILPYASCLFEKDFRPHCPGTGSTGDGLERFRRLIACSEPGSEQRVLVKVLPPLRAVAGRPANSAELDKDDQAHDPSLRRAHYEQVGQLIAEIATVLIAVMDADEAPDQSQANGGTARVVAFRRAGQSDARGRDVARRSDILPNDHSPIVAPPASYVWLLDPNAPGPHHPLSVTVLPPLIDRPVAEVYSGHPGSDLPLRSDHKDALAKSGKWCRDHISRCRTVLSRYAAGITPGPDTITLLESLRIPYAFVRFERRRPREADIDASPLVARVADPLAEIAKLRQTLSPVQRAVKRRAEHAFLWVAILFVCAVLVLEVYTKLFPHDAALLGVYLMILLGIVSVVLTARG
jgi:hypothetical protein